MKKIHAQRLMVPHVLFFTGLEKGITKQPPCASFKDNWRKDGNGGIMITSQNINENGTGLV